MNIFTIPNHNISNSFSMSSLSCLPINKVENASGASLLFLGKEGVGEDALHIIGQQIPRVFKSKKMYDIVFYNRFSMEDFASKLKAMLPKQTITTIASDDSAVTVAAMIALQKTTLKTIEETDFSQYKKIYILGHGTAGGHSLIFGPELLNVDEVISRLVDGNVLKVKDIRLTSCGSADKEKICSFTDDKTQEGDGLLSKIMSFLKGNKMSFLDKFIESLEDKGHDNIKVSGYHGVGVFYTGKSLPFTHLRSITLPPDPEQTVKRSTQREMKTTCVEVE
ncbi:OspB [Escherichia fergusonii]|uniref:OspB n=1 Tax=Escherichia fergusonii TaxID=564 RepID=UPI001ED06C79|nr:OspB [Escherichia fergusonii]EHJ4135866.1 OspB [Escherichia fergusonii]